MTGTCGPGRAEGFGGDTVGGVIAAQASAYPERTALVFEDAEWTYRELDAAMDDVARGLIALGAARSDSIGVLLPNCAEYLLTWLGAARGGLVEVPINTHYKGRFLDHALRSTDVRILVTDSSLLALVADLPEVPELLHTVVLIDDTPPGRAPAGVRVLTWRDMLSAADPVAELPTVGPGDPVGIMLTSGTTGLSKGVVHPNRLQVVSGRECAQHMGSTPTDRLYSCLPLFHGASQLHCAMHAFTVGAAMVLGRRFSASRFWDEIRARRATWFISIGTVLPMIMAQPPSLQDRDHPVRKAFAAPAPAQVLYPFEERFGVDIVEGYGVTEIGNVVYNPTDGRKVGSIGLPTATTVLEVHDETGRRAAPGEVGEIVYRPREPHIMFPGYYRNPEETLATMHDLWWHTGDLGYTDEDGYFYFVDRKKDALRRRGENISSYEVESILFAYPGVAAAAALATPSDLGEDEVLAVLQLESGQHVDFAAFFEHCDASMPHFMVPRYYRVVDQLPLTPSGKIRKIELREQGRANAWDAHAAGHKPTRHA